MARRPFPPRSNLEFWLWDRRSNTQTRLAGQEEDLYYIGWPAGSVVHLRYVPGTEPFERVYLSISAEGGWHVTPRQWAAGTPTRVLGEWAGSVVTALRVAEPARYRLAAERGERAKTLALGDLRWGST